MTTPVDLGTTPADLPVPEDDGACDHLPGRTLPSVALPATSGEPVDLSAVTGRVVVYVYPMTGRPGEALPTGWDAIPGARGCTPQSCAFPRPRHRDRRARRRSVRPEHPRHRVPAGGRREAAPAVRAARRRFARVRPRARAADLRGRRHDADPAADADRDRWHDREGLLPRLPAGAERGRRHGLASGRTAEPGGTRGDARGTRSGPSAPRRRARSCTPLPRPRCAGRSGRCSPRARRPPRPPSRRRRGAAACRRRPRR